MKNGFHNSKINYLRAKLATANRKRYFYLKTKSRNLRNNSTNSEKYLWNFLRKKKFNCKFRRQHVIGSFVVDLVCLEKKLIIEVDGEIHDKQKEADEQRTYKLESLNFRIIRFKNEEVLNNTSKVLREIYKALEL